jgi:hypothetical protein
VSSKDYYLIEVSANGVTSGFTQRATDLLDAMEKVRGLQASGQDFITVRLAKLPPDYPWPRPGAVA